MVDRLRSMVSTGLFLPGMKLGQSDIAQIFNSSTVPVREALQLLASEGLVEHDPRRGFYVTRCSLREAALLFEIRHKLEDKTLLSLAWPSERQIETLAQCASELDTLFDREESVEWWIKQRAFHQLLFDLCEEKVLVRETMRSWSLTSQLFVTSLGPRLSSSGPVVSKKHDLIQALARHEREALLSVQRERRLFFEQVVLQSGSERVPNRPVEE